MARIAMVVTNSCAPDPRVERHASWLAEKGHEVEIHAWDRECLNQVNEIKNGYKIIRYRFGKTNHGNPIATWFRKKRFISKIRLDHDLLILNDTDTMGVKFNGPVILDIHDLAHSWPLMRGTTLLHKLAARKMEKQAKKAIISADEIIVAAPGFGKWVGQFGRSVTCVMNRRKPQAIQRNQRKIIGYFGRIREFDSISFLVESANLVGFKTILAGDGTDVDKVLEKYPDIDYRGPFNEDELPSLMKEISVMYAMYDDRRTNIKHGAIPTKMLDAAAFGIPSITNANTPMGDLCEKEGMGLTAPYGDTALISKAMEKAHNMEINIQDCDDNTNFISVVQRLLISQPT